ncbi:M24 family metallopeptidase [Novosphingobium kaempferiae]|uniref:M24 family metallopeptidase n=1 Tax=Novosphingobium kaempferiae TaxID=2896849 RepID=UPI001E34F433|nr:Xaa-Pro peptidase family protein [Novosphingobium kaempferiae]
MAAALPLFPGSARIPDGARPTKVPQQHMPLLSLAERDRRWDRLRKKMRAAKVDCLLFTSNDMFYDMASANTRYIFHVGAKMALYGLFMIDRDPVMWNSPPHMNRPYNFHLSVQDWVDDIRPFQGFAPIAETLRELGLDRGRIGLVAFGSTLAPNTMLQAEGDALRALLPNAVFQDMTWVLEEMRLVKSEEEIGHLRKAGKVARQVIDAVMATARPGVLEAEVFAEMVRTQIANGCEPNVFNLFNSGPVEHPSDELWHLLHGVEQPQIPSMRPLSEGDLILTEYHTKYGGYSCHTEYSIYLGKTPPSKLLDLYKVSVECLDVSKEVFKVGNTLGEVWRAIRKPAEKAGYDWVELGFHAMGLASPEFPSVVYKEGYGLPAANGHQLEDFVLEEGMCFGNNIDLYDPDWKPDVGTMLADFMVVRPGSAEVLVNVPRELGVVA